MTGGGETIGLIAGNGQFPRLFAQTARAQGVPVVAVAHRGESLPGLEPLVEHLTWIDVGALDTLVDTFHAHGVRRALMAGGIDKAGLMERFKPDARGVRLLQRVKQWSDDALLRELAAELESEGIEVIASTTFLDSILTEEGVMSRIAPDETQWRDIRFGMELLAAVGRFDVGQTVVVKSGMVLAVEAIEGTDAALRRGGALGRGGSVAVKASKPAQDLRFDVPAVGLETIAVCAEAGIAVLALEAGKTLMFDRAELLRRADEIGVAVVGFRL